MNQLSYFSTANVGSLDSFAWAKRGLACLLAVVVFALAMPLAQAQETTVTMRGTVLAPDGTGAAGVPVTITDTRTGGRSRATTNASGIFTAGGLRPGGPYTIKADSDRYADATVSEIFLSLGETYTFTVSLGLNVTEEIITTAARIKTAEVAVGPSATFDVIDLEAAPAINRDIKDLIKIDPRIYIDEGDNRGDTVQCAGANPRFNSLTVDGVRLNDNFGLNRNGYPTTRLPFSYDSIQQVAVELAPFDVQYGGFTACNINAVFKSGENEFFGSAFYDYTSDSLTGDSIEGAPVNLGSFDEKRYGFSLGGPIMQDKLFFFLAYEKLDGVDTFARGAAGSGRAVEVEGVSQAQADRIEQIARSVYGYEPGGLPASIPVDDEKILVKFDWNINDNHRASFTYNWNDGFAISESDGDSNELEFSNHYYERGNELTAYVGQLFSDWTDNFSTEIRISNQELDNRQIPLGGVDFGEVQIRTFNDPDGDGNFSRATVYLGADDSRHANDLAYESWTYKFEGTYDWGNHRFTGGFEQDDLEIFNMFIQEAEGEYRFTNCGSSNPSGCIDAFETGDPDRITYENASPSNVKMDAAALFGYKINTWYLQDEYNFSGEDLSFIFGLRYDWYDSNDVPTENPNFIARNGFTNAKNFDGESLLQPRFGFTWDATENLSLRGGVGLYSGGNPNVWLSNNYSNNGITQVEAQDRTLDDDGLGGNTLFTIPFNGGGRPIYDIPQALFDAVASGTVNSGVNAIDPNFQIPSQWKYSLGATLNFDAGPLGSDYTLNTDLLYTQSRNSARVIDNTLLQIGAGPDGRPIYRSVDRQDPDCATAPTTTACSDRFFNGDFILTNTENDDGHQSVFSFALSKEYDFGLDWTFAYSYTESKEVSPMTSSVAFSNWFNVTVADYNNPGLATSNYEIPHRATLRLNYRKAFFGDYETKFTVFGTRNEGRPFSYTFSEMEEFFRGRFFNLDDDRQLLYMPTGASDPKVQFDPGFDQAAFFAFADAAGISKYGGQIVPRNVFNSDWWTKFDVRVSQELPGFMENHRASAYLVIENFGNFLNDDWGVLREASFPRNQPIVEATIDPATNQYVFEEFFEPGGQSIRQDASLWEIRVGVRYSF